MMSLCPLAATYRCPTKLQPTENGSLVDGVAAHLKIVHKMGEKTAFAVAKTHCADREKASPPSPDPV